ncbi:MAG TPA: calcium-binding protein, partial [Allocoleopsis sp.]
MFAKIPERRMHFIRWGFAIGWGVLILSLFYDPISAQLTEPNHLFAASTPTGCFQFQGECRPLDPYPMGARIFWGMVLPLSILTLLILGHEAWRR